ncbi:MAG: OmpA family protein [Magnetococcales bacterium]|nr:OmpA family protein [Magnetococcales bacterium]
MKNLKKALLGGALAILLSTPAYAHDVWGGYYHGPYPVAGHDADGDRITDGLDHCPGTSALAEVNHMGCPVDNDMDGIPDYRDDCGHTPPGVKVDSRGCRIDSDIDGVPDDMDKCPNTPWGDKVDTNGCSIAPKVVLYFGTNSAKVSAEGVKILGELAKELQAHRGSRIEIQGHADARATSSYNASLGERRAAAVKQILLSKFKVAPTQLVTTSLGEERPRYYNAYPEGRDKNRRVEIFQVRELHEGDGPTSRQLDSIR